MLWGRKRSEQDKPDKACPGDGRPYCYYIKNHQGASLKGRKDPEIAMEQAWGWRKSIWGRRNSQYKGPELGVLQACWGPAGSQCRGQEQDDVKEGMTGSGGTGPCWASWGLCLTLSKMGNHQSIWTEEWQAPTWYFKGIFLGVENRVEGSRAPRETTCQSYLFYK